MSAPGIGDTQLLLLFLAVGTAAIVLRIGVERLQGWFWRRVPVEFHTAGVGALVAVFGLMLAHERRWWIWAAWIAGLGGLGWWIAHRVMGSVQSRSQSRQRLFQQARRTLGREVDPRLQAFLSRLSLMSEDDWRDVVRRSRGLAAIRRAAALRATERTVSNLADAVTPVVWEALVKSLGAPPWKPSMPEIERRADLARGAGEAVLAREQISTRDFEALYAPFEPMVPASALLPAPGRASLP